MFVIMCGDLRTKYDSLSWNEPKGNEILSNDYLTEMIDKIDYLQEKYRVSKPVKLLLFDLAENGEAISDNKETITVLGEILEEEKYRFEVKEVPEVPE